MVLKQVFGTKGRGINSIPVRFALMSLVLTGVVAGLGHALLAGPLTPAALAGWAVLLVLPPSVNFLAANKLAGMIMALRNSTQALVSGDFDRPVDIDCDCEVGGLADSFRAMVARLNSNILRMNVLAYTDAITGLPNRTVIAHILGLPQMKQPGHCAGAMIFIDLDGFKRVNDTLGHDAGDELLRQVALRIVERGLDLSLADLDNCTTTFGELCQSCPNRPVLARFAGDEFLLLLPGDQTMEALKAMADRIRHVLSESFTVFNNEVLIGASLGIARMPHDTDNPEQLLAYADIAMYRAKEAGKNASVFFDASLRDKVEERAHIERELHKAIDRDSLTLHYQPKFDAMTMELTGVEALARWTCPLLGPVSPDLFIGIAERCGIMVPLGNSILRIAIRQARQWVDAGRVMRVAVNVSPVQFEKHDFVPTVFAALAEFGLSPELLELEITETIAMANFAETRERVDALRAAGITIAIDDFGIGYSNLSQLARLDYDALKVDRSLIASIGSHGKTQSMLGAIVGVSKALGHKVVAEGIENMEQFAHLRSIGCEELQGYLLARPMPANELEAWLDGRAENPVHRLGDRLDGRLRERFDATG